MTDRTLISEGTQGILHLTLNAPRRRNALSRRMLAELGEALPAPGDDWRAVVLSGSAGTFSAGADLTELTGTVDDAALDASVSEVAELIAQSRVPVIAAIEGACLGAGLDLAMACDLRIAGRTAFFELPATRLGILYHPRAVARWRRALSSQTLSRLLVFGERIEAADAAAAGIVARVVADGEAVTTAQAIARGLLPTSARATAATKALLHSVEADLFAEEAWEAERIALLASPQRRDAILRAQDGKVT